MNQYYHMTLSRFIAALATSLILGSAFAATTEVQDINKQFRKGDLTGALQGANTYLAKNPKDAQARFLKGLILAEQGKSDDAIQTFTALTEDFPELPEPYNNLAVLYAAQNKFDDAKSALEMAIRSHPNYATAHENLGDIYAKMASIAYEKASQLDANNASVKTKLATLKDIVTPQARRTTKAVSTSLDAVAKPAAKSITDTPTLPAPKPAFPQTPAGAEASVAAWARAWASRDVDTYLAFYASDFSTPDGLSRPDWEAQRRERITQPDRISIVVSDFKTRQTSPDKTSVSFKQTYQSDRLSTTSNKTLDLVWRDGTWLIVGENTR
jgi:tetratricopeptide (TPR) repeat protein